MKTSYHHKYHPLFPLNNYVWNIVKTWKNLKNRREHIKKMLHFWSYALGFSDLMKAVNKKIVEEDNKNNSKT